MRTHFPTVHWDDVEVTFYASPLPAGNDRPYAVVIFARHEEGFVLADIPGRGWITPSGRLEPGETPLQAAVRETREEIGTEPEDLTEIGYYTLVRPDGEVLEASAYVGYVREYGNLYAGTESRGTRLALLTELPALYWRWDSLLEAMFEYAFKINIAAGSQH